MTKKSSLASMPDIVTTKHPLSPQQQSVIDWVRDGQGSAFVEAVAGSGKTYTLIEACKHMAGSVAFTAFNRKIAEEIKIKVGNRDGTRVATFHSFGFGAWRRVAGHVQVDADQKRKMMLRENEVPDKLWSAVSRMVSIAKQSVVDYLWDKDDTETWQRLIDHYDILLRIEENGWDEKKTIEKLIEYASKCIAWSREIGKTLIDFDDMIWLPLVEDAPIYQNDWVLVDEAQDTNPARRLLAERMLRPGGRMLWVGDRHQAIYGFTGADADAVQQIVDQFKCELLPLTVTFRCSKRATALAQSWVPHIEAFESNDEGSVSRQSGHEFYQNYVANRETTGDGLKPGDAILCRNTRPLVGLAFQLIRDGVACHVEGRDIGKQLDRLASKWKVTTAAALTKNLEAYRYRETVKLQAREAQYAIEALNDRIDTLLVIMDGCETVFDVRAKIDRLFKDTYTGQKKQTVVLSTVHKAKGREWDRVFILGFDQYMPSRWARQEWEQEQERNLLYVAATRTKSDLVLTGSLEELNG